MTDIQIERPTKLTKVQLVVGPLGFLILALSLNYLTSGCPADAAPLIREIESRLPAVSGLLIYLRQQQALELSPDLAVCKAALTISALSAWLTIMFVAHWIALLSLGKKRSATTLVGSMAQMRFGGQFAIIIGGWVLLQLPLAYFLLSPSSLTRSGIGFDFSIWWLKLVSMFILSMAGLVVGSDALLSVFKRKMRRLTN
jgi:hypothetical protein